MSSPRSSSLTKLAKQLAVVRIGFGIIWAIDAFLKYQPAFYNGIVAMVKAKDAGEPGWLNPWFHMWYNIIGSAPHVFAVIIIIAETLTAVALILGIARKMNYALGALLSLLIWTVGEGFGGPYVSGTTDINAGLLYMVVYLVLYAGESALAPVWTVHSLFDHFHWQLTFPKRRFVTSLAPSITSK